MLTRRDFLKGGLAAVSVGIGVPSVFARAATVASAENSAGAGRTLVVVQLAGGVDGLNTVIPYKDGKYRDLRPQLAVPESEMLVVDDHAAFHPSLASLKKRFDAGKLAVVEGVGYPDPTFSHFKAMDIWQSADPKGAAREGWLGKYFDGLTDHGGHPLAGLSVGTRLPSAFESDEATVPSVASLETFALQQPANDRSGDRNRSLLRLYDVYKPVGSAFGALLDTTLDNATASSTALKAADAAYTPAVTYPESSLASGLQLIAELIESGGEQTPLRVGHVTLGGFDTHTQQAQTLTDLLGDADAALDAFMGDIEAHGHGDDVLVMTWSEFGRRVPENGQAGTDHGSAGPMFLLGNAVKGGFHGEAPSLSSLDNGNLRYTVDFRTVYATILDRWLESPADDILGGHFDTLDLLAV
jgi:uncharacterized protein (DUF1501 family)